MSLAFLSLPQLSFSHINQSKARNFELCGRALPIANVSLVYGKVPLGISKIFHTPCRNRICGSQMPLARKCMSSDHESVAEDSAMNSEQMNQGEEDYEDLESTWEGAVIYKRNSYNLHSEYCTTLERLGLGELSSENSVSKASAMGLRTTKAVKDVPHGTPVQISVDVTRRIKNLRLDGIIKTVLTCYCSSCCGPATKGVFVNFTLLLSSEPVEPETLDIGDLFAEEGAKPKSYDHEDAEDASIDIDDRMYFPPEDREIDISKYIRDLLSLELSYSALSTVCDPGCKGMCYTCGANFNTSSCNCKDQPEVVRNKSSSPFSGLREQMKEQ